MNFIRRILYREKLKKEIYKVKKSLENNSKVIDEVHRYYSTPEKLTKRVQPLFERRRELELKLKELKSKL